MSLGEAPLPSNSKQGGNKAPIVAPLKTGVSHVTKNAPSQTSDDDANTHFGHAPAPQSGGSVKKSVPQEGF